MRCDALRCDEIRCAPRGPAAAAALPPSPGPGAPRSPGSRSRSPGPAPRQQRSPEPGAGSARSPRPPGSRRCRAGAPGVSAVPAPRCRSPPGPRPWQPWPGELPACEGPGVSGRDPRPGRFACCRGGRARDAGLGQGQSSRCALRAGKFCLFQNNGLAGGSWFFFCSFRAFRCLRSRLSCGGLCCSSSTSGNAVMK